jgi:4'-phosphopantetheinyl transferase
LTISSEKIWNLPPSPPSLARDSVHVWRIELAQPIAVMNELETLLAEEERQRAGRFHFLRDRRVFVVTKGAARQILAHYLSADPRSLIFDRGAFGKPFLCSGELRFNLSHSGEFALLAVAREREVGVDVEQIREIEDAAMIAEQYFSPGESGKLRAVLDSTLGAAAFFNCWTRKEAFIKAIGEGLSHPLDTFEVTFLPQEKVELRLEGTMAHRWMLCALPADGRGENDAAKHDLRI